MASDKLEALGLAKDIEYLTNIRAAIAKAVQTLNIEVPEGLVESTEWVNKDLESVREVLTGLDEELVDAIQDMNDEKDKKAGVSKKEKETEEDNEEEE